MISNIDREKLLENWLKSVLKTTEYQIKLLAGDASFRRYYRVQAAGVSYVVMDAPPPESPELFVNVAKILQKQSLLVPNIIDQDLQQGFLLLSDLGDRVYLNELNATTADPLYQAAFAALLTFQKCDADLPRFDRAFLQRQMGIFEEWYLNKHKGVVLSPASQKKILPVYQQIFQIVESQPAVFVHRDYHSRNLMVVEHHNPGILDFQDAMIGPMTYDLVSLLQDCYIAWPRERVEAWVASFQDQAIQAGHLHAAVSKAEFLKWFDWTGVQRHLKNLGIFARLHHRDHKSGYLKDIPQVLKYLTEAVARYPELSPLQHFLEPSPETVTL